MFLFRSINKFRGFFTRRYANKPFFFFFMSAFLLLPCSVTTAIVSLSPLPLYSSASCTQCSMSFHFTAMTLVTEISAGSTGTWTGVDEPFNHSSTAGVTPSKKPSNTGTKNPAVKLMTVAKPKLLK